LNDREVTREAGAGPGATWPRAAVRTGAAVTAAAALAAVLAAGLAAGAGHIHPGARASHAVASGCSADDGGMECGFGP
jgi:hypothetical protein